MKNKTHNFSKIIRIIRQDWHILVLVVFSFLMLVSVARYGMWTQLGPTWDEQHYMHMASSFYRLLEHPSLSTPSEILKVLPVRQPGYPLAILPFLLIFGLSESYFWGMFTNGIFYVITIWGVYFLAKEYLSKLSSFIAAFMFGCYGWTLLHLHTTFSETSVSAMSVLAILFLIKSDFFQKKKYALLFGLFFGLGLLMKWEAFFCILGPLVYVLYRLIKNNMLKKRSVLIHLGLAIGVSVLVISYPYSQNVFLYFNNLYTHRAGGPIWEIVPDYERNPLSLYSLTYYFNTVSQLGIIYFLLFIGGFVMALRRSSNLKPIVFAFLFFWLFLTYSVLKAERHSVGLFPYVAILSASVFDLIKDTRYKRGFIIFILLLSWFSFLGSAWGKGPMKQSLVSLPIDIPFGRMNKIYLTSISRPPYFYKITGKEIIDFIVDDTKKEQIKNPQVTLLFSYRSLDEPMYTYNLYHFKNPLQVRSFVGSIVQDPDRDARVIASTLFQNTDYLLVKTGRKIDFFTSKNNYQSLEGALILTDKYIQISDYFEQVKEFWVYQDSSVVTVFKKKKTIEDIKIQEISENLAQDLTDMKRKKVGTFAN